MQVVVEDTKQNTHAERLSKKRRIQQGAAFQTSEMNLFSRFTEKMRRKRDNFLFSFLLKDKTELKGGNYQKGILVIGG